MFQPSRAFEPVSGETANRVGVSGRVDVDPASEARDLGRVGDEASSADGADSAYGAIGRRAARVGFEEGRRVAHERYLYRLTPADVKSSRTGTTTPMTTPMQLAEVLERIEARLKILDLTENAASRAAGKPDAIRNLRRGVQSGARKGISTATLSALAPVLKTSAEWLLTGRSGPDAEETAMEAAVSLPYADAILALTLAFEALRLGSDVECRILARAVLAASRTRRSPRGGPFSDDERRQLVSEAICLFRTQ